MSQNVCFHESMLLTLHLHYLLLICLVTIYIWQAGTIFYTEILTRKVDFRSFFPRVKHIKKYIKLTFQVKISVCVECNFYKNTRDLAQVCLHRIEKIVSSANFCEHS